MTDTIRMEPFANWYPDSDDDERTIITVFTGGQWEQFGPEYNTTHEALQAMASLKKWRDREVAIAMASVNEALNQGDGVYRP